MLARPLVATLLLMLVGTAFSARKYDGPRPPKPDVPYLVHADKLIETEVGEAKEEERGRDMVAWVAGTSSAVRTPLAEPIFLIETDKLVAEKIELYRFETKRGRREVVLPKQPGKNAPRPLRVMVTQVEGKLYRIEANETLENGEYSLSPAGSNQVFCFQVY